MATARLATPSTSSLAEHIRQQRRRLDARRPGGLHLSSICDDIAKILYPSKYRGLSEAQSIGAQEIGNAYEDIFAEIFRRKFSRWRKPEPRTKHGIIGSPDGENRNTCTIHETKATWVSRKRFLVTNEWNEITERSPKFSRYEMQIMGYLYIWGWTRAQLDVWFINGDYPGGNPIPEWPYTYILRYTPHELRVNWRRLVQHAVDRKLLDKRYLRRAA